MCTHAHGNIIKELYIGGGLKLYLKAADPLENDKIVFSFFSCRHYQMMVQSIIII
jgi:hypothetical protein